MLFLGVVVGSILVAALYLDFTRRTEGHAPSDGFARTAIVFTGQFDRIYMGLDLIAAGRADRLFITGANPKAGVHVGNFVEQFRLTPTQAEALASGRIVLAEDAHTTLENALETACWLDRQPEIEAVTLITSRRHMARASLALTRAISPVSVARLASDPSQSAVSGRTRITEFRDFLATWAATLLPRAFWPANRPALCDGIKNVSD